MSETDKKLKILVKEPYKAPYVKEIDGSLESMQKIVGGYIECVPMPTVDGVDLYVNEEGKLEAQLGNFWLPEYEDCAVGTCFMVGFNPETGETKDITDRQIKECNKYIDFFKLPKDKDLYFNFDELEAFMKGQARKFNKLCAEM